MNQLTPATFAAYECRGWDNQRGCIDGYLTESGAYIAGIRKVSFVRGLAFVSVGGRRCPVYANDTGKHTDLPIVGRVVSCRNGFLRPEYTFNA